nr:polysaccharide biosynthesis tyrosine autokinase [Vibrio maerlii]
MTGDIFQLKGHLLTLKSHAFTIIAFTIIFGVTAAMYIYSKPSIYQANATLLIQDQQKSALSIDEVYGVDTTKKEYFQTQIEILKSNHIASTVIADMGLEYHNEFKGASSIKTKLEELKSIPLLQDLLGVQPTPDGTDDYEKGYYSTLNKFKNRLVIEPVRNTQLVKIGFRAKDPKLAAEIANRVGQAYIDSNFEAKLSITQNAANWLTDNAAKMKQQLNDSEQRLQDYLQQEGLVDLNGIDDIYAGEIEDLSRKISEIRNRRIEAETRVSLLRKKASQDLDSLLSMDEFANQAQIRDLKLAEIDAEKLVSELSQRYGPKHDKMIQANAQLEAIRTKAKSRIRDLSSSMQQDLNTARTQELLLLKEMKRKRGEFQDLGSQRAKYDQLRREVESNKKLYEALLNREKETDTTSDYQNVTARFTDRAMIPLFPVAPQRVKLTFIAAFLGFVFISVIVVCLEIIRNTISNYKDVEDKLGAKCLGVLPYIKNAKLRNRGISYSVYHDREKHLPYSEACRSLRTSLLLHLTNKKQKFIAVTSAIPGEGKTATSINLATSLASMERVLLIDCDLRRPSIAARFDIAKSVPGLSQILSMDMPVEQCIVRHEDSKLEVITSGLSSPNAQELLQSSKFSKLLAQLEQSYDRIIIDTPPLLSVSDALIIGQKANGLITVVKSESTKTPLVNYALQKQLQHDVPSLGVVVNQAKGKAKAYLYEQQYAYSS